MSSSTASIVGIPNPPDDGEAAIGGVLTGFAWLLFPLFGVAGVGVGGEEFAAAAAAFPYKTISM